jgi:predicted transcriptional regulator
MRRITMQSTNHYKIMVKTIINKMTMTFRYFTNIILSKLYKIFQGRYNSTHFKDVDIETQSSGLACY